MMHLSFALIQYCALVNNKISQANDFQVRCVCVSVERGRERAKEESGIN